MRGLYTVIVSLTALALLAGGCSRRSPEAARPTGPAEQAEHFTFRQLSRSLKVELTGETAEVSSDRKNATVGKPALSLASGNDVIEITTGPQGKAVMKMESDLERIQSVVMEGAVHTVQRDASTKAVKMEADCRKMTFREAEKLLILEGDPVVTRGGHIFSGDRILYHLETQQLDIEGKVNVVIRPEHKPGS